jgi:RecG-like helicase
MKHLKLFETWNNNIIDRSLFISGRAKYEPKISNGVITYKTGDSEPYYTAEITKKGGKFICKIYKIKKNGKKNRIKNKMKNTLKTAHNYVREYLNQRLKKKTKKKEKPEKVDDLKIEEPQMEPMMPMAMPMPSEPLKSGPTIHRFY